MVSLICVLDNNNRNNPVISTTSLAIYVPMKMGSCYAKTNYNFLN